MSEFKISRAQPEHAAVLTEITVAAKRHWNYPEKWIQLWLPALTISADYISTYETWMAVIEDVPVAYYSLQLDDIALLDNLWVLPDYMGKGIGKALVSHAMEKSRLYGASLLKIEADPNAQAFYEHMGARKVGERRGEVDGTPRILPLMEIRL